MLKHDQQAQGADDTECDHAYTANLLTQAAWVGEQKDQRAVQVGRNFHSLDWR
jgi:hypothetical protein